MNRKTVLAIAGLILCTSILGFLCIYYITPRLLQTRTEAPTPAPQTFSLGKFIIIPHTNSLLSPAFIAALSKEQYDSILVENPDDKIPLETSVTNSKIYTLGDEKSDSNFTKCAQQEVAEDNLIDSNPSHRLYYLSRNDCNPEHKIVNIIETVCLVKDTECLIHYTSLLHKTAVLYNEDSPFMASFPAPSIAIDQESGFPIITWATSFPNTHIAQASYSIELLNAKNQRIFASGKINKGNQGDYYIPTTPPGPQELTIKLRIWYAFEGNVLAPQLYTSTFNYTPALSITDAPQTKVSKQIAWIPDWGMKAGIASVQKDPKKWDTVSPVWFSANKDGSLHKEATYNNSLLVTLLRKNKIKLVPTISIFSEDILKNVLHNHMNTYIKAVVNEAVKSNYDGIDLDYESTYKEDKDLLLDSVTKLATALHAKGKTLSFTAIHKLDDRAIYSSFPQTLETQDWKSIGNVVDQFRIMAYDFTGQSSSQPGPISPIQWDEALIKYAVQNMSKEKIILALPLYSQAWPKPNSNNLAGTNNDKSLNLGYKNTLSLQHDEIAYVKTHSSEYKETYDAWNKEVRATFKYKGVNRVMYYLNKKAVDERIELGKKYGIAGVAYWRIGGESL